MKTVVTGIVLGIVFSITLIFVNRVFASDAPVSIRYPSPVAIHALSYLQSPLDGRCPTGRGCDTEGAAGA
jgi:hypothetical protein